MDEAKLKEIKSAEEKAKDILENAKKDFAKVIAQATEEGLTFLEKEKAAIKSEQNRILGKFRSEGETEASRILAGLDASLANVDSSYKKNHAKAAEYLLKEIKGRYGNR